MVFMSEKADAAPNTKANSHANPQTDFASNTGTNRRSNSTSNTGTNRRANSTSNTGTYRRANSNPYFIPVNETIIGALK